MANNIPLVEVNHLQAHVLANFINHYTEINLVILARGFSSKMRGCITLDALWNSYHKSKLVKPISFDDVKD